MSSSTHFTLHFQFLSEHLPLITKTDSHYRSKMIFKYSSPWGWYLNSFLQASLNLDFSLLKGLTYLSVSSVSCLSLSATISATAFAYECSCWRMVSSAGEWTSLWYTAAKTSASLAPALSPNSIVFYKRIILHCNWIKD